MKAKLLFILFSFSFFYIFSQSNDVSEYFEEAKHPEVKYKNILKINYLRAALNGNACFNYERYITPNLSLDLEAGITYFNLYLMMADNFTDRETRLSTGYKFGYSAGAGVRFYFKKEEMDGWYLNPGYRFLQYNRKENTYLQNPKRIINDIYTCIGYQMLVNRFSFDYYVGSGPRFDKAKYHSGNQAVEIKKIEPLIMLGFRFGYIF